MDFVEATDMLTGGPTLSELAEELGVTAVSLSRARTAPSNRFYRSPPEGWEDVVADLAREQAERMHQVAERLAAASKKKPVRRQTRRKRSPRRR